MFRRRIQTRRPARRARIARPPTAAPAITPTLDFLAGTGSGVEEVWPGLGTVVMVPAVFDKGLEVASPRSVPSPPLAGFGASGKTTYRLIIRQLMQYLS